MSDYTKLKELAEAIHGKGTTVDMLNRWARFEAACKPELILGLIAENERLAEDYDKAWRHDLNDKNNYSVLAAEVVRLNADLEQAKLIGRISYNFDGYKAVLDEHDQLKVENDESAAVIDQLAKLLAGVAVALKGEELLLHRHGYHDLVEGVTVLRLENDLRQAENDALRNERKGMVLCELELFETLRDAANTEADEHRQCMATYRPLRQANLDSVVKKCDGLLSATGKGERS